MDRDINLLFGVVAVQYDQITPSDFVDAVEAWANEPTADLSAYLIKAGALSQSDREFVSNLVNKELDECGGDPSAALERVGGEEAIGLSSFGHVTLVGSHGLKLGHSAQPHTDPPVTEPSDDGNQSLDRSALKTEVATWRLIGFLVIAVALISAFAMYSYSRIVDERNTAREAQHIAEKRSESAELQVHLAQEAQLLAENQRMELEQQSSVAKRQKALALDAIKNVVFELPERLGVATASDPVLHDLLKENIAVLDSILRLEPDSLGLQIEKSENQALIGSLWGRLGEFEESVAAYKNALALTEGVLEREPDEVRHRWTLARRYRDLGTAYAQAGSYDDALAAFEKSLIANENLLGADTDVSELKEALSQTYAEVGNILTIRGAATPAAESYEKSLGFNEQLLEWGVQNSTPARSLESMDTIGVYEAAVAHWDASIESKGDDRQVQIGLAQSEMNLGLVYAHYGSYSEALEHLDKCLRAYQGLSVVEQTVDTVSLERQARAYYDVGLIHSIEGSFEEAKAAHERAIAIMNDLFKEAPESATIGYRLAAFTYGMGRLHLRLREYESASARFGQMIDIYRRPTAREALLGAELGSIYPMYAQALGELRHAAEVKEVLLLREAYIGLLQYFARLKPDDVQILAHLADTYVAFGTSLERDEQADRAYESFRSALDVLEGLASYDLDDLNLGTRISRVQLRLSRIDEGR